MEAALARFIKEHRRSNPDLTTDRVEKLAVMGLGLGLTGALSGVIASIAAPLLAVAGPFGKPLATLATAIGLEHGAGMVVDRSMARNLGDGGILLALGQGASAAGLPVGISSTFPRIPGLPGGAPAAQLAAGNTPSGTGAMVAAPAGGRYQPVPGYGSLSPQLGVGL